MIHVVVMKCLIGLPLLMHMELLRRSRSRTFKNRGVGVGVGSFKNRGHLCTDSTALDITLFKRTGKHYIFIFVMLI
jgi:hypothetical protein